MRPEQAGLAAGAGGQVEPAFVGAVQVGSGQRDRDELGALVLHRGPAVGDGLDGPGVAAGQVDPERREPGGHAAGRAQPARPGRSGPAGRPDERRAARRRPATPRRSSVRSPLSWPAAGPAGASRSRNAPTIHRGCAVAMARCPSGSVSAGGASRSIQLSRSASAIRRSTALTYPRRAGPVPGPDQFDGGRHRGVRRYPGVQQLVGAQPEGVDDDAVQIRRRRGRRRHR